MSACWVGIVLVWAGGRTHASRLADSYAAVGFCVRQLRVRLSASDFVGVVALDVASRIGLRRGFRLPSAVGEVEAKPLGDELLPVDSIGFGVGGGCLSHPGGKSCVRGRVAARGRRIACRLWAAPRFDDR